MHRDYLEGILSLFSESQRKRKKVHILTRAEVKELCLEVQEYFAVHWRDDDNPEIECKMRRSWCLA